MTGSRSGPLRVAVVMMFVGVLLHGIVLYSDVLGLWLRDDMGRRPVPYFDYALEYPVGMGLVIWLLNRLSIDMVSYYLLTAAVLVAAGVLVFRLARSFPEANLWLLALSPTLPLYVVLNWDIIAIALTVAALVLFRGKRDSWGMVLLTAAVWTKFFPIVIVPLVLLDRLLRRRWGDAARGLTVFGLVSVALNAPVALVATATGWQLRAHWLYFFRLNAERDHTTNIWYLADQFGLVGGTTQITFYSGVLFLLGTAAVAGLVAYRAWRDPATDVLLPAALAALAWWFLVNKVYSPQYALWLAVFLALVGAPIWLAIAFGIADVAMYAAFPIGAWRPGYAALVDEPQMVAVTAVLAAALLAIVLWAVWRVGGWATRGHSGKLYAVPGSVAMFSWSGCARPASLGTIPAPRGRARAGAAATARAADARIGAERGTAGRRGSGGSRVTRHDGDGDAGA